MQKKKFESTLGLEWREEKKKTSENVTLLYNLCTKKVLKMLEMNKSVPHPSRFIQSNLFVNKKRLYVQENPSSLEFV